MTLRDQHKWRVFKDAIQSDEIRGKYGVITEYADGMLDVWVTNIRIACRMERDGWMARKHYEDGAVFIRPFDDLDAAAGYLKARKRRVVTEVMRQKGRDLNSKINRSVLKGV